MARVSKEEKAKQKEKDAKKRIKKNAEAETLVEKKPKRATVVLLGMKVTHGKELYYSCLSCWGNNRPANPLELVDFSSEPSFASDFDKKIPKCRYCGKVLEPLAQLTPVSKEDKKDGDDI